jgi:hypothetical protein
MLDKDNLKWLFSSGAGERLTVEEFNKMVEEWLDRRMKK